MLHNILWSSQLYSSLSLVTERKVLFVEAMELKSDMEQWAKQLWSAFWWSVIPSIHFRQTQPNSTDYCFSSSFFPWVQPVSYGWCFSFTFQTASPMYYFIFYSKTMFYFNVLFYFIFKIFLNSLFLFS